MAEFAEVMKQLKRMCKGTVYCSSCPLMVGDDECLFVNRTDYMCKNAEKIEKAIMDWAEAHPEPVYPSWKDAWNSLFPNAEGDPCPANWFGDECPECIDFDCLECMKRPMSREVAEKLGVMPIAEPIAESQYEHDGCERCKWMDKDEYDEPCVRCRGTRYSNPDLWTPKEGER